MVNILINMLCICGIVILGAIIIIAIVCTIIVLSIFFKNFIDINDEE